METGTRKMGMLGTWQQLAHGGIVWARLLQALEGFSSVQFRLRIAPHPTRWGLVLFLRRDFKSYSSYDRTQLRYENPRPPSSLQGAQELG